MTPAEGCRNVCIECPTRLALGAEAMAEMRTGMMYRATAAAAGKLVEAEGDFITRRDNAILEHGFGSHQAGLYDIARTPEQIARDHDDAVAEHTAHEIEALESDARLANLRQLANSVSCEAGPLRIGVRGLAVFRMCRGQGEDGGKPAVKWTFRRQ